jgi:hypothetical protein
VCIEQKLEGVSREGEEEERRTSRRSTRQKRIDLTPMSMYASARRSLHSSPLSAEARSRFTPRVPLLALLLTLLVTALLLSDGVAATCMGSCASCAASSTSDACGQQVGCTWEGRCEAGATCATACEALDEPSCVGLSCSWVSECSGECTACEDVMDTDLCGELPGCELAMTTECTGICTPCASLDEPMTCGNQTGCR